MTPGATPLRGGGGVVRPAIPGAFPAARIVLPGPFSGKTAAAVRAMEMMAAGEVFFLFFQVFWFSERPCLEAVRPDRRTSGVQAEGLRDCLTVFCNTAGLSGRCLQHRRAVCPLRPLRQATDSLVSGRHFGSALLARREWKSAAHWQPVAAEQPTRRRLQGSALRAGNAPVWPVRHRRSPHW